MSIQETLVELCTGRVFPTYQTYKEFIWTAFYKDLSLDEYPDRNLFQKEIINVAVKLKVVPYHYFDKN